jgi:hypothetical protein
MIGGEAGRYLATFGNGAVAGSEPGTSVVLATVPGPLSMKLTVSPDLASAVHPTV